MASKKAAKKTQPASGRAAGRTPAGAKGAGAPVKKAGSAAKAKVKAKPLPVAKKVAATKANATRGAAPAAERPKGRGAAPPAKRAPAAALPAKRASEATESNPKKPIARVTKASKPSGKVIPLPRTPKAATRQASSPAQDASQTSPVRLQEGDAAPSFVLQDETGTVFSSESLRGSPYIIYFYPRDDTPGCTLQACGFRDSLPRFNAKGVRVIGVSPDSPESHSRFKKKYGLTFPLLSDPEKTLSKAYGVWVQKQNYGREYMGVERSTFVVDKNGTISQAWRGVRVPGHVDTVLDAV